MKATVCVAPVCAPERRRQWHLALRYAGGREAGDTVRNPWHRAQHAINAPGGEEPDFNALEPHIERVLRVLLVDTSGRLLNVNLPAAPRGMTWTRQAVRHYDGRIVPGEDPMGRKHFWFTVVPIDQTEPGTDLWAMERGYISITPLSLDLTDQSDLARLTAALPLDAPPAEERTTEMEEDESP